jgi:type II secretory pathway component PulF
MRLFKAGRCGKRAAAFLVLLLCSSGCHKTSQKDEVKAFTQDFAARINAGQPLADSLKVLIAKQTDPKFKSTLKQVEMDVEMGSTLSRALEFHPEFFSPAYVEEVRRGENPARWRNPWIAWRNERRTLTFRYFLFQIVRAG